ncbi:MAG: helix-turn-helix domain-containing protein [Mariniphaga sp.]|nr:helix-turn-helix domain-containing protein [Mariniphaga sp.]
MEYIFLIAAFNAFFFSALLIQKKPGAAHDKILIFWLVYLGFFTGVYGLFYNQLFRDFPLLSASFISLLLLHGPFLYFYLASLIRHSKILPARAVLHFIPFILFNLYLLISLFFPETSARIRLDHSNEHGHAPLLFNFFLLITALSGPFYFLLAVRLFKKLDVRILRNFSTPKNSNLAWLRTLVYVFGAVWTALMLFAILHHIFQLFSWMFCTHGLALSLSVFILLIGYFGLRQKEIFHSGLDYDLSNSPEKVKYASTGLSAENARQTGERLKALMKTEKPFLNPELSLPQLAEMLDVPAYQLSQVINSNFNQNYFDFVNTYRVEEVKTKICDPAFGHLSFLGIAFESGFNSKSAFNRIFKKTTGKTPTHYRLEHRNSHDRQPIR